MPKFYCAFIEVFIYTLSISLMVSLFVAMTLAPLLNFKFLGKSSTKKINEKESKLLAPVQKAYEKVLAKSFVHPWICIGICLMIVIGGAILFPRYPCR